MSMYRLIIYITAHVYIILLLYAVYSSEYGDTAYDYPSVGPCDFNNATSNYENIDAVSLLLKA